MRDVEEMAALVASSASATRGWQGVQGTSAISPLLWDPLQTLLWLDSLRPSVQHDPKAIVSDNVVFGGVNGSILYAILNGALTSPAAIGVRKTAHALRLRKLLLDLLSNPRVS